MSRSKPLRAVRTFQVAALVYNLGSLVYHAVIGGVVGMILGAACIVALVVAMEREVYGETFEHDGAPGAFVPPPPIPFMGTVCREDAGFEIRAALRRERKANCKLCDRMERERHSNLRWERPS